MIDTNKIMIGTAQFGMNYGIANQSGQVNNNEIHQILQFAYANQITAIDTASQYGESEAILGNLAQNDFKFYTKLPPIHAEAHIPAFIKNECLFSLRRLQRETCEGLLIHRVADLLEPSGDEIYQALLDLKTAKKIIKIGVSVYSPEQVYQLIDRYELDVIQFPFNLLDQRFKQNNLLQQLKEKNIELHARSIFLQGLLLMHHNKLPGYFEKIKQPLTALYHECQDKGLTVRQALIEFAASHPEIDKIIIGIDSYQQFTEIVEDYLNCESTCRIHSEFYRCDDSNIINPMNWKIHEKN